MRRGSFDAAAITGGAYGTKAVTLAEQDEFLDWLVSGGDGDTPDELYAAVVWVFWCINKRADNIARLPYKIYPIEIEEDEDDKDVEFGLDLRLPLWYIVAARTP